LLCELTRVGLAGEGRSLARCFFRLLEYIVERGLKEKNDCWRYVEAYADSYVGAGVFCEHLIVKCLRGNLNLKLSLHHSTLIQTFCHHFKQAQDTSLWRLFTR
jgi:hypothetical protein